MVEASGLAAPWFTRLAVQGVTAKVMAAQDFLLDSQVQAWLDGLEPAWTLLTFESLQALRHEPAATRTAIRIANDLSCDEIARSSIARNTLILLRAAIAHGGLPLTATGNLTRAVVAKMCTLVAWPNYDQADAFRFNKVINEPDFQPLHVVRQLVLLSGAWDKSRCAMEARNPPTAALVRVTGATQRKDAKQSGRRPPFLSKGTVV